MQISIETLVIFAYLIPGFVSTAILNAIIVRRSKDSFGQVVEALVFSFAIYALISIYTGGSPVELDATIVGQTTTYMTTYNPRVIIPVFTLALILPLILGASITNDWHMILLRKIKVTHKTARESVWLDVFTDQRRRIIVNLDDGTRVFGWPLYYSDTPEEGKVYLYRPAYLTKDGKTQPLPIHGLFLVKQQKIASIEFLKTHAEKEDEKNAEG